MGRPKKPINTEDYLLGANVKYLREKMGLSQAELGNLVMQSEYSIFNIESRGALPSVVAVRDLSILFGVTMDDLLFKTLSDDPHVSFRVENLVNEADVRSAWMQYRKFCQQYTGGTKHDPCKGCKYEYEPDDCFVGFLGEELNG